MRLVGMPYCPALSGVAEFRVVELKGDPEAAGFRGAALVLAVFGVPELGAELRTPTDSTALESVGGNAGSVLPAVTSGICVRAAAVADVAGELDCGSPDC